VSSGNSFDISEGCFNMSFSKWSVLSPSRSYLFMSFCRLKAWSYTEVNSLTFISKSSDIFESPGLNTFPTLEDWLQDWSQYYWVPETSRPADVSKCPLQCICVVKDTSRSKTIRQQVCDSKTSCCLTCGKPTKESRFFNCKFQLLFFSRDTNKSDYKRSTGVSSSGEFDGFFGWNLWK
jgi:hypothetical protein